jgi:hypothetical protein
MFAPPRSICSNRSQLPMAVALAIKAALPPSAAIT